MGEGWSHFPHEPLVGFSFLLYRQYLWKLRLDRRMVAEIGFCLFAMSKESHVLIGMIYSNFGETGGFHLKCKELGVLDALRLMIWPALRSNYPQTCTEPSLPRDLRPPGQEIIYASPSNAPSVGHKTSGTRISIHRMQSMRPSWS